MSKCLITGKTASVAGCQCETCKTKRAQDTQHMRDRRQDPEFRQKEALNMQKYRQKNPEYRKQLGARSAKLHTALINLLGGAQCVCQGVNCWHQDKCVVNDARVAQLDHKNGGGVRELKSNPAQVYRYYLAHPDEAKQKLQVHCANCNWVKRHNNPSERGGSPKTRDWENSKF